MEAIQSTGKLVDDNIESYYKIIGASVSFPFPFLTLCVFG